MLVMHVDELTGWLSALPDLVDRAEVVLTGARMERAFRSADERRRVPEWQSSWEDAAHGPSTPRRGSTPVKPGPGPRDYSLPIVVSPARDDCAGPGRHWAPPARKRGRAMVSGIVVVAVLAAGMSSIGKRVVAEVRGQSGAVIQRSPSGGGNVPVPAHPTVNVESCKTLTAADVSTLLGTQVYRLPPSSSTSCTFGTVPNDANSVIIHVEIGAAALATPSPALDPRLGTLTYRAGASAPDGSGRILLGPIRIGISDAAAPGNQMRAQNLAEAVASQLVAATR